LVALILSKHPGLTPFEVKAVLAAVADNARPQAGEANEAKPSPRRAGTRARRGSPR
jgi:hypothetical protein